VDFHAETRVLEEIAMYRLLLLHADEVMPYSAGLGVLLILTTMSIVGVVLF